MGGRLFRRGAAGSRASAVGTKMRPYLWHARARLYCWCGADKDTSLWYARARIVLLVLNISAFQARSTNVSSSSHSTGIYFRFQLRIGSSAPGPGDYDITVSSQVDGLGLFYLQSCGYCFDRISANTITMLVSHHSYFVVFLFNIATCRSGIMLTAFPFPAN